jgi:hypothetical protein
MEFKGTKGKWKVGIVPDYNNVLEVSKIEVYSGNAWICKVQNKGIVGDEEGSANALLISKAPEMLEMLKLVRDGISEMDFAQLEILLPEIEQLLKEATEI